MARRVRVPKAKPPMLEEPIMGGAKALFKAAKRKVKKGSKPKATPPGAL